MKTPIGCLALAASALICTSAMAGVTFYESENFSGQPFVAEGTVPNFVTRGFNDRARSAVVEGSAVEVCRDINFSGGCTVMNPGSYSSLGEWSAKISSVRPVNAPQGAAVPGSAGGAAKVTFYEAEDFEGRAFSMTGVVPSLAARGFNDRAESAVVEGGPVEVCVNVNFGGGCTILSPGRHASLGDYRNRISSVRPVASAGPVGGRGASATLFSGPNLSGRAVKLDRDGASDLGAFRERASSLVVERGYWIFCTEPEFGGECRTFGPGEYRQLPPEFDNRIASGRRIANNYPYANRPNWETNR